MLLFLLSMRLREEKSLILALVHMALSTHRMLRLALFFMFEIIDLLQHFLNIGDEVLLAVNNSFSLQTLLWCLVLAPIMLLHVI